MPGLSIRTQSGKWIDAPAIPDAYVVNGGQMLQRWTNDVFLATPHRAINRSGGERYAIPFFCDSNIDWPVAAVPTTVGTGQAAQVPDDLLQRLHGLVPEAELRRAQRRQPASGRVSDTQTIPIVDLGPYLAGEPGALERTARELRFALTEIGFYFIVNHGVPEALIRGAFEQAARFHGQPLDRKMEVRVDKHNVGYLPMRGDTLRTSTVQTVTKANLNEAFFMARDLADDHPDVLADRRFRSANRWPRDLPGFREAVVGYCDALERLVAEAGAALRRRARAAGGLLRRSVPRVPVQAAHDALPLPGSPGRRRVRHRPAHRHQLPDPARPQRRARPVDPHAKRQMDRRAASCPAPSS